MFQGIGKSKSPLLWLLCCFSLAGCVSVTVEEEKVPEAVFDFALSSHPLTNLDLSGRPSPTVVRIYQLRKEVDFNEAGFFDLYDQDKTLLANDLLAREEFIVVPGSFVTHQYPLDTETKFISVMAAFQNTANAIQKQILAVDPTRDVALVAYLNANVLSVTPNGSAMDKPMPATQSNLGGVPAATTSQGVKLENGEVKINPLKLGNCKDAGVVDLLVKEGC